MRCRTQKHCGCTVGTEELKTSTIVPYSPIQSEFYNIVWIAIDTRVVSIHETRESWVSVGGEKEAQHLGLAAGMGAYPRAACQAGDYTRKEDLGVSLLRNVQIAFRVSELVLSFASSTDIRDCI